MLNWVRLPGAESCIAPVELARRVEDRLGRQVFARASDAIVVIEGRVAPDPNGFTTVIRVSDPEGSVLGSRELSVPGADCHKLDEIVALIISITIRREHGQIGINLPSGIAAELDALFADEPSELDPSELRAAPAPARTELESAPPPPQAAAAPVAAERVLWLQLTAAMAMSTGLAPSPSFGPLLRLGVEHSEIGSVALAGGFGFVQKRVVDEGRGTLVFQPLSAALEMCWDAARFGRVRLALCAYARLGLLRADARNFMSRPGSSKPWFELAPAASVRTRLFGPSYLHFLVGIPWRIVRPRFQYRDSRGELHDAQTVARFGLDLELGLGVEF